MQIAMRFVSETIRFVSNGFESVSLNRRSEHICLWCVIWFCKTKLQSQMQILLMLRHDFIGIAWDEHGHYLDVVFNGSQMTIQSEHVEHDVLQ